MDANALIGDGPPCRARMSDATSVRWSARENAYVN